MHTWFVHPWLLTFAASLVLLWLLPRWTHRTPRVVAWGAAKWLEAALARQQAKEHWRRWILLFRALMLVALACCIAIPRIDMSTISQSIDSPGERTWWIIVVDDGPAASYRTPTSQAGVASSTTRFEQAIAQVRTLLSGTPQNDAFSLVGTTAATHEQLHGPSMDRDLLESRLSRWSPVGLTPYGSNTLLHIERLIDEAELSGEQFDRVQVVVWSSRGSRAWAETEGRDLELALTRLTRKCSIHWRDLGQTQSGNIAIESVAGLEGSLISGFPHRVSIRVANRDRQVQQRTMLNVREEGELIASVELSLAPLETTELPIEFVPQTTGFRKFEFSTGDDTLAMDSTHWRIARVVEQLNLVIMTSDPLERRSWVALVAAMKRFGINIVETLSTGGGQEVWSPATSIIIVGRMPNWSADRAANVKRFIESGGTAWIACGSEQSPALWLESWQRSDYQWRPSEKGLSPLSVADKADEGLLLLQQRGQDSLSSTPIWRQWRSETKLSDRWTVELVRDSAPLMISTSLGRGKVSLWLSSWGAVSPETLATANETPDTWSAFAVWPSFPAVAQQWILTQVGHDSQRFMSLDRFEIERAAAIRESRDWNWRGSTSLAQVDFNESDATNSILLPSVMTDDSSSESSRMISVGLDAAATAWTRENQGLDWVEVDEDLPRFDAVHNLAREADIATPLALALLALFVLESWLHRAATRRNHRMKLGVLLGFVLLMPLGPSSLLAQTNSNPAEPTSTVSTESTKPGSETGMNEATEIAERVIWLPSWSASLWQIVALGVVVWGASLWLSRVNLKTKAGLGSAILRGGIVALLLLAAQGWQERRLVEQPTRVATVIDLSASMAQTLADPNANLPQEGASEIEFNAQDRPWNELTNSDRSKLSRIQEAFIAFRSSPEMLEQWPAAFGDQRFVDWYSIGASLERYESWPSLIEQVQHPDRPESRLSDCLRELLERNAGRSLSAVVLITDGVSTQTQDVERLIAAARDSGVPWYPVLLGDPSVERSLTIHTRGIPATVFVGETIIVSIDLSLQGEAQGEFDVQLVDLETNEIVASERWISAGVDQTQTLEIPYSVKRSGANRFTVRVVEVSGESVVGVGKTERFQAIEHRSRILLVASEPSLEFRFLKHAIERARQPGSIENPTFELKSWLQSADLDYPSTDSSAIRGFPVDDAELEDFDVVILLDPTLASVDRTRGLSETDLQRIKRHVESNAASLILVAGSKFDPAGWSSSSLESMLPCPASDFRRWEQGTGIAAENRKLVSTPLGLQMAALREWPDSLSSSSLRTTENSAHSGGPLSFEVSATWTASRLRSGVRPLLVTAEESEAESNLIALTQASAGRGLVVFQGFADAYRLRFRSSDRRANGYWIQTLHQLARHRWMDQHPLTTISADQELYRAGETAELSITRTDDQSGSLPVAWVVAPGAEPRPLELERVGAHTGWYLARVDRLQRGTYLISIDGTEKVDPTSFAFDVLAARQESDRQPPDHEWLRELAEQSGGRTLVPAELPSPSQWLPRGRRAIISVGPDLAIWHRASRTAIWGLCLVTLLFLEWRLRDLARSA